MSAMLRWIVGKIQDMRLKPHILYVHPRIERTGSFQGSRQVATFKLRAGKWIVIAKASAQGYGGNTGLADCRLKITGSEGDTVVSDESYGSPPPLLGTTMTVLLPFNVKSSAQFHLQADVQGQPAEFLHIAVTAVRDTTATE